MKKIIISAICALALMTTGCAKKSAPAAQATPEEAPAPVDTFVKESKLCDLAAKYGFKVGACISYNQVNSKSYNRMLTGDFNTTTATNEFKAYSLLNQQKSIQSCQACTGKWHRNSRSRTCLGRIYERMVLPRRL